MCSLGTCNTDSEYLDRMDNDLRFIAYQKPKTNSDNCQRWIRRCRRPHSQLNSTILPNHSKPKHVYICSKVGISCTSLKLQL